MSLRTFLIVVFFFIVPILAAGHISIPENPLQSLRKDHPRLLLHDERLSELQSLSERDPFLQRLIQDVLTRADSYISRDPVVYKVIGPRLLSVSRECLNRVMTCSLAYRWTKEKKYADSAIINILAACRFKDWNPSHYLDTAEMSNAVGIGYDWLYHYMDETTRQEIRAGLIKHGLEEGFKCYTGQVGGRNHWFVSSEHNWNQVCNGGMIVGELAIADTDPQYAQVIMVGGRKTIMR